MKQAISWSFVVTMAVMPGVSTARSATAYQRQIYPLLTKYCFPCHGNGKKRGGVALDRFRDTASALADRSTWRLVMHNVRNRVMPPEHKPQPTERERDAIVTWIDTEVFRCDPMHPDPGRVTIRRLNRTEYNNTIRDLAGVDFRPAEDFPQDDVGYGFDNIGDVLSMPPLLLEKYLAAAEKITALAVSTNEALGALPLSHRRIFICRSDPGKWSECAREILANFARRAWRRPVTDNEVTRLLRLAERVWREENRFERGIEVALQAVLVSPHFLFRGELQPEPDNPGSVHPVDEFALASRLSYFLWSSMPDDELFALAEHGALRQNLNAQVRRMLKDPKANALIENFGGQWLELRKLQSSTPDPREFPAFDEALRAAMLRETELLFETIMREDRSVLEFLTANYSYVNARLARHYGIKGISGDHFRKVSLKGTGRMGVLTHASVLTLTSNPTRTSPVKRGKYVLDNILGSPPPPPPPNVPQLKEGPELTGTLRKRMEQHRENPLCASCHERMDPIGFGLEHFDGIGAWRTADEAQPIDSAGRLITGEQFTGSADLLAILAKRKRAEFVHCLVEKMLTYALGRGLDYYDKCAVEEITAGLKSHGYRFSALVLGIAGSTPFQMRRGEGDPLSEAGG